MKMRYPLASALILGMALTACSKPEDPAKTEADMIRAAADGQAKVSEAASTAVSEHMDNAAQAVEDGKAMTTSDLKTDVDNVHAVDTARSEANYKVSKERCDSLAGDAKDACLSDAKKVYEAELDQAKAEQTGAKKELDQQAEQAKAAQGK